MTTRNTRIELLRIMSTATDAQANFHIWKTLKLSRDESKRPNAINDYEYVDFFHTTIWGSQTLVFLSLGKIFDKGKGTLKVCKLVRGLNDDQLNDRFDSLSKKHKEVIDKVMKVRNKTVAHNEKLNDDIRVFQEASVTPNEIESLIDDIRIILNAAADRESISDRIPEGLRFKNAVHSLLDRLRTG